MDMFREDGLESKTLYSDHHFFFRILKNQIERMLLKEQEDMKQIIEARKKRKKMAKELEKSKTKIKTANRKRVSLMNLVFDRMNVCNLEFLVLNNENFLDTTSSISIV